MMSRFSCPALSRSRMRSSRSVLLLNSRCTVQNRLDRVRPREFFALQVLQPARSQITPPVALHPAPDGGFAKVTARFLAFNPFVAKGFLLPIEVYAGFFHGFALLQDHPPTPASVGGASKYPIDRTALFEAMQAGSPTLPSCRAALLSRPDGSGDPSYITWFLAKE